MVGGGGGGGHRAAGATVASPPHGRQFRSPPGTASLPGRRRNEVGGRGGNWSGRTLFTQFAVKMKSLVPKRAVTEREGEGPRRLLHQ